MCCCKFSFSASLVFHYHLRFWCASLWPYRQTSGCNCWSVSYFKKKKHPHKLNWAREMEFEFDDNKIKFKLEGCGCSRAQNQLLPLVDRKSNAAFGILEECKCKLLSLCLIIISSETIKMLMVLDSVRLGPLKSCGPWKRGLLNLFGCFLFFFSIYRSLYQCWLVDAFLYVSRASCMGRSECLLWTKRWICAFMRSCAGTSFKAHVCPFCVRKNL